MPIETERGYKVTISFGQRRVLLMLSQRGRRVTMNTSGFSKAVKDGLADLDRKGLVVATPLVGTDRVDYLLTDLGAQVVDQMMTNNKAEVLAAQQDPNYQAMMYGSEVCDQLYFESGVRGSQRCKLPRGHAGGHRDR